MDIDAPTDATPVADDLVTGQPSTTDGEEVPADTDTRPLADDETGAATGRHRAEGDAPPDAPPDQG